MARKAAGKLFSGLVVGAAIGATLALVFSSRDTLVLPRTTEPRPDIGSRPTPFEPINEVIVRAKSVVEEVRSQVRLAIEEGKSTAAETRQELTARFEAAKRDPKDKQGRV